MKLSRHELEIAAAALSYALAASPDVRQRTRYENLRKKIDRVLRQGRSA